MEVHLTLVNVDIKKSKRLNDCFVEYKVVTVKNQKMELRGTGK